MLEIGIANSEWNKNHPLELQPTCLGVIIPVYNEVEIVNEILRRVLAHFCVIEVVVVDDCSNAGASEVVNVWPGIDKRVRVIRHSINRGKGAAIRSGLIYAHAPVIIIQDADLEYDLNDYDRLLRPIRCGQAEVVYGSRFSKRSDNSTSWWHRCGNGLLTWATNDLTGLCLTDEATCYKVFRSDVMARLALKEDGFGFCPEVTVKISKLGVRLIEVPIRYSPRSRGQGKNIRFRDGFDALRCFC